MRALPSHPRQNRVVAAILASASATSGGAASPSGPREGTERAVARQQGVPRPDAVAFNAERQIGHEADRLVGTSRIGHMTAAVNQCPLGFGASVVEGGLADEFNLDAAFEALDRAHQHMVAVVVGRRPGVGSDRVLAIGRAHRQRVTDDDPAPRGPPGGHEHVRPGFVVARGRMRDSERPEPKGARLPIEQAAEHARRVETWHAEPVDRAVRRDQSARMTVGEERVVRNRGEG